MLFTQYSTIPNNHGTPLIVCIQLNFVSLWTLSLKIAIQFDCLHRKQCFLFHLAFYSHIISPLGHTFHVHLFTSIHEINSTTAISITKPVYVASQVSFTVVSPIFNFLPVFMSIETVETFIKTISCQHSDIFDVVTPRFSDASDYNTLHIQ